MDTSVGFNSGDGNKEGMRMGGEGGLFTSAWVVLRTYPLLTPLATTENFMDVPKDDTERSIS